MPSTAGKQRRHRERNKNTLTGVATQRTAVPDRFRVDQFDDFTYVSGATLWRFWARPDLEPSVDGVHYFLVYTPTAAQVRNSCDKCVRRHQPRNGACSLTRHSVTTLTDPTRLYRIGRNSGPDKRFTIVGEERHPRSRVRGLYVRIEPL